MKPFHTFVLVNQNAGEDVTSDVLTNIAAAVDHVLQNSFKAAWGGAYRCRAGDPTIGPNEVAVQIQADSSVQGAAGFHDLTSVQVFRDGLPSLTSGAFSLSVVVSHEVFETAGDLAANRWADDGNGQEFALELCDAVEGYSFEPTIPAGQPGAGVSISDFLYSSFFDPGGQRPFSRCDKPTAPFTTASDSGQDYQIVRTVDENGDQQVTAIGNVHASRLKAKAHPSSRTSRRGVVLSVLVKDPDETLRAPAQP